MRIARLGPGDDDAVLAASPLFDDPARPDATARFLTEPGHHLFVAYHESGDGEDPDEPVGFISGVELVHPDKGVELFIYELGVAEAFRRRGVAAALLDAFAALGRELGCYDMFVLTEANNDVARAFYASTPATDEGLQVMYTWPLGS